MDQPRPATLFTNGRVVTVDAEFSIQQAALVADGRIVATGSDAAVGALAPAHARRVDLGGRSLLPGFIDTHGHIALFGLDQLKVSLAGATTRAAILAHLEAAVAHRAAGEWIVVMPIGEPPYFLDANAIRAAGEIPSLDELDAIAPHNPVYIQAPTNRVPNFAVLNSAALHAAGIGPGSDLSPHTRVLADADGRPTGIVEGAMQPIYNFDPLYQRVEQAAPRAGYDELRDGIAALAPQFIAHGTTTLLEAHLTSPEELRAYAELRAAGRLPLRIFYTFEIDFTRSLDEIRDFLRTVRFAANGGFGDDALRVCGVSIGLDGPYWHGAAVHDRPYPGPFGDTVDPGPLVARDHYDAILDLAADMNFRIHAEAAGRGSIGIALDAFERIDQRTPIRDKRYVLEHCEFPTREQIARCARLGVAATTSTNFVWGKGAEVYRERLGADDCAVAIPLRDWLDGGVPISQSTDWGPREAMFTLWQSLARQAGLTGEVIGPAQVITREEAIRAFTLNGAWALRMEHELGSIEAGKRGDLIVLDGDVMGCPTDELRDMTVDLTMIDGAIVHERS
ncbi:MAG: amidohydrolase [Gammaproteobacteria bacterium]|nr:amidohydrolase [Gammaproteobacteria bacterium]